MDAEDLGFQPIDMEDYRTPGGFLDRPVQIRARQFNGALDTAYAREIVIEERAFDNYVSDGPFSSRRPPRLFSKHNIPIEFINAYHELKRQSYQPFSASAPDAAPSVTAPVEYIPRTRHGGLYRQYLEYADHPKKRTRASSPDLSSVPSYHTSLAPSYPQEAPRYVDYLDDPIDITEEQSRTDSVATYRQTPAVTQKPDESSITNISDSSLTTNTTINQQVAVNTALNSIIAIEQSAANSAINSTTLENIQKEEERKIEEILQQVGPVPKKRHFNISWDPNTLTIGEATAHEEIATDHISVFSEITKASTEGNQIGRDSANVYPTPNNVDGGYNPNRAVDFLGPNGNALSYDEVKRIVEQNRMRKDTVEEEKLSEMSDDGVPVIQKEPTLTGNKRKKNRVATWSTDKLVREVARSGYDLDFIKNMRGMAPGYNRRNDKKRLADLREEDVTVEPDEKKQIKKIVNAWTDIPITKHLSRAPFDELDEVTENNARYLEPYIFEKLRGQRKGATRAENKKRLEYMERLKAGIEKGREKRHLNLLENIYNKYINLEEINADLKNVDEPQIEHIKPFQDVLQDWELEEAKLRYEELQKKLELARQASGTAQAVATTSSQAPAPVIHQVAVRKKQREPVTAQVAAPAATTSSQAPEPVINLVPVRPKKRKDPEPEEINFNSIIPDRGTKQKEKKRKKDAK